MRLRIFRIPLIFLLFGSLWAISSDPVITMLARHHAFHIQDSIRGFNDIVFVLLSTILIYGQVRKEQRQLKQSEEQYRTLFFANPNPMWIYHIESRKFIEVNQAAINKYGYSRNEFLSMTIMDIRPAKDIGRLEDAIKIGETTMSDGFIWEHITSTGEHLLVSITSHHLTFNNQYCSMVMVTDVTEVIQNKEKLERSLGQQKQLNDQLEKTIRATRLAHNAFREIAWAISHEIRRPLASVLSLIGMLKDAHSEQERNELYELLETSSVDLDNIVKNNIRKINDQEQKVDPSKL